MASYFGISSAAIVFPSIISIAKGVALAGASTNIRSSTSPFHSSPEDRLQDFVSHSRIPASVTENVNMEDSVRKNQAWLEVINKHDHLKSGGRSASSNTFRDKNQTPVAVVPPTSTLQKTNMYLSNLFRTKPIGAKTKDRGMVSYHHMNYGTTPTTTSTTTARPKSIKPTSRPSLKRTTKSKSKVKSRTKHSQSTKVKRVMPSKRMGISSTGTEIKTESHAQKHPTFHPRSSLSLSEDHATGSKDEELEDDFEDEDGDFEENEIVPKKTNSPKKKQTSTALQTASHPSSDSGYSSRPQGSPDPLMMRGDSSGPPVKDSPTNFLNLVGTDFQPARLVNIWLVLCFMMGMIVSQGYMMWVYGLSFRGGAAILSSLPGSSAIQNLMGMAPSLSQIGQFFAPLASLASALGPAAAALG